MNKTKVKCINTIKYHKSIKIGDIGYIDGYVRGGDEIPYIVCIFGKTIAFAEFYNLEVVTE